LLAFMTLPDNVDATRHHGETGREFRDSNQFG
jgi:hypothetical protein